jgi:Uncharacterised nucleotidyltransferase
MKDAQVNIETRKKSRSLRLKEAVIASFWEPAPSLRARFSEFSLADWQKVMNWLDVSGLALYLFDRLKTLELQDCLPSSIRWRLRRNLADNCDRSDSLFAEAVALSQSLKSQNIVFALLKGVTLPSESVPDNNLRLQVDLDILIREPDGARVQECLRTHGYELDVISGSTWEFKAGIIGLSTIRDIYRVRPERALDLRLLPEKKTIDTMLPGSDLLDRAELRYFQGVALPALSSPDIFVQQAVHLFKHMCSEHSRASWVLEFWRHISARRNDAAFWRQVEVIAAGEPQAGLAVGAAVLLTSLVFGPCAPEQLARWSLDRLSPAICLWIQMYGRHALLADNPRSKLYLILLRQLRPDSAAERTLRRRLIFPIHMPQRVTRGRPDERLASRLLRYRAQARFVMMRLVFHAAEGFRLAFETIRWQRRLAEVTQ